MFLAAAGLPTQQNTVILDFSGVHCQTEDWRFVKMAVKRQAEINP